MSEELDNQGANIVADQANYQQEESGEVKTEGKVADQKTQDQLAKEKSIKDLRERAETAERRNKELEHYLVNSQPKDQPTQKDEEDYDFDIKDDDFIEGKHLKKYVKNLKKELNSTKKQIAEFNQSNAVATAEVRLKSQFNDFDSIVTKENLDKLAASKPSLYRSIISNQDIYDRGYTAYEMIKHSGIISHDYEIEDNRLAANKTKPRSSATAAPQSSDTPLARAGDYDRRVLTEERKEQLLRQVEEAKRNR